MNSVKGEIYEFGTKLGCGAYGQVYTLNRVKDNKTFAFKKYVSSTNELDVGALREISILQMLKKSRYCHKYNIICLQDIIINDSITGIVLPLYKMSLDHAIDHNCLYSKDKFNISHKLLRSVCFLHNNNIIHRDIKPDNIMLDENCNPILIDFTLSKMFYTNNTSETHTGGISTEFYRAPEVVARKLYGFPSDAWSLGIVLREMYGIVLPKFKGFLNTDPNDRLIPKDALYNIFKENCNINIYTDFISTAVCETIHTICENLELEKNITYLAASAYYNISNCDPYLAVLLASKFYETVPMDMECLAIDKDEFIKEELLILNKMNYNLNVIE